MTKTETDKKPEVKFGVDLSRGFTGWLARQNASLAVTTYQVGKLIMFGTSEDQAFWTYNRNIGRCLGMTSDRDGFWVTSDTQLFYFKNLLAPGEKGPNETDALYAPRMSYFTGDLDIHDLAIDGEGGLKFVNTLFNCVSEPSTTHSFAPIWKPDFISRLAAEDRCHLNGLAMVDGKPKYATAVGRSDVFDGWRNQRTDGGVVIDIDTGEIVCSGLSMPHSPRWYKGKLWLNNSGTGEFGYVDLKTRSFVSIAFCPGYLRGLDFIEDVAVVGLSQPRDNKTFAGLPIDETLSKNKAAPRCGLCFVDLKSGDIIHSLFIEGLVTELYDVVVLKGVKKPSLIGPMSEEIKRTLSFPHISTN